MPILVQAVLLSALLLPAAGAQWNPQAGQWGKTDPADVRVLTWNVRDAICSSADKSGGANNWTAVVCTLAALKPDVVVLQECGDNTGNGTGSGLDPVTNLALTFDLLLHGGFDPFTGQAVGAWVQAYAPACDLPYVFVSAAHDGFNRNAILSRWPFEDLNGNGQATSSDFFMLADKWVAEDGGGGIRGYATVEIDLPDGVYAADLVVGNSHLRAGVTAADHAARVEAAQRIAYVIDHLYNGAGTGVPDPAHTVLDPPPAASILAPSTALVTGGDWNEDEETDGTKGPAEWIISAETSDGDDGTDRDRSDMTRDAATDWFTGQPGTLGTAKVDGLAWQDSIAALRRAVVFDSQSIPVGQAPAELAGFPASYTLVSGSASDHRAVLVDLRLPLAECNEGLDLGFGTPGTGGLVPRFTACGTLGGSNSARFVLQHAASKAAVAAVVGLRAMQAPFVGGTLVPAPLVVCGGLFTDASGGLVLCRVPGLGRPLDVYIQWIVVDPGAAAGMALSNALKVSLPP